MTFPSVGAIDGKLTTLKDRRRAAADLSDLLLETVNGWRKVFPVGFSFRSGEGGREVTLGLRNDLPAAF